MVWTDEYLKHYHSVYDYIFYNHYGRNNAVYSIENTFSYNHANYEEAAIEFIWEQQQTDMKHTPEGYSFDKEMVINVLKRLWTSEKGIQKRRSIKQCKEYK